MARPNTHFEDNRLKLIKIAFTLFMEKGYENTSINDILKAAAISKGAMYHYFSSKEDVLDAVLNYIVDLDSKAFEPVINNASLSAWEKLLALIRRPKRDTPDEVKQALEHLSERPSSIFDYRSREISLKRSVPALAQIIRAGVQSGEFQSNYPEELAEMMLAVSQSINLWIMENPSAEKIERELRYFSNLLKISLNLDQTKEDMLYQTLISLLEP